MFKLIKTLTEMSGPVGQETDVIDFVENLWCDAGVQTERTRIGNLLGTLNEPDPAKPNLIIAAHADELCYLVRDIHPDGYLWLANGQGWSRTTSFRDGFTIGQRVRVLARDGEIAGVIGTITGHLASIAMPPPSELNWDDFWVDTGLSKTDLLKKGVHPGTRIIWDAETVQFGDHVVGKALDDRVFVAILCELIARLKSEQLSYNVTFACTVQEEIGIIGAQALAKRSDFDLAIAMDIGMAGDVPTVSSSAVPLRLGDGPMIVHKDSLVHYDYALTMRLGNVAKSNEIRIQHAVFGSFGSDGAAFMRADIPAALIGVPVRYTHTPFETAHLDDIAQLTDWLEAFMLSE